MKQPYKVEKTTPYCFKYGQIIVKHNNLNITFLIPIPPHFLFVIIYYLLLDIFFFFQRSPHPLVPV